MRITDSERGDNTRDRKLYESVQKKVLCDLIHKGKFLVMIKPANYHKHREIIVSDRETGKKETYYFICKKEPFHKCGLFFNHEGEGESINMDILQNIFRRHIPMIYVGYHTGQLYCIKTSDWLHYSLENGTMRNTGDEVTASVPLAILTEVV